MSTESPCWLAIWDSPCTIIQQLCLLLCPATVFPEMKLTVIDEIELEYSTKMFLLGLLWTFVRNFGNFENKSHQYGLFLCHCHFPPSPGPTRPRHATRLQPMILAGQWSGRVPMENSGQPLMLMVRRSWLMKIRPLSCNISVSLQIYQWRSIIF